MIRNWLVIVYPWVMKCTQESWLKIRFVCSLEKSCNLYDINYILSDQQPFLANSLYFWLTMLWPVTSTNRLVNHSQLRWFKIKYNESDQIISSLFYQWVNILKLGIIMFYRIHESYSWTIVFKCFYVFKLW